MSQRNSGYERKERNLYETPEWVSLALHPLIPDHVVFWEPACASGNISKTLVANHSSDLVTDYGETGVDFLLTNKMPKGCNAIITNPPFGKDAEKFIRHSLKLLSGNPEGFIAMLLPVDFDSAKTRRDIFTENHGLLSFAGKLILTKRITWFEPARASPSANHAWYIWQQSYDFPQIWYYYE